ncbi:FAD/NAD(P)-binding protein [bacterium]|nr:FAD/NAD(P)-binding protein [bacterium]MCK4436781.1 FAD/NAD(P)-binding protein [bacterium]
MKNPYLPVSAEILEVIEETPNIKTFVLKPKEEIPFRTGQFMELTVPGIGEAPFTPSSSPQVKEKLDFTVMNAGKVTSALHKAKPSDKVGVRGPYGAGYPLDEFKGREVLIVGGGVGLAPLRSFFLTLIEDIKLYQKITFCYGARTPSDIVYKNLVMKEWPKLDKKKVALRLTVDAGDKTWKGKVGLVTTTLDNLKVDIGGSVAVVCGPPIMMKFTTFKLIDLGYKPEQIYLSMEKNMSCGIGKCGHCMMGKYYVCKDGPVFTYDKIKDLPAVWD